jgi:hypothetical protein
MKRFLFAFAILAASAVFLYGSAFATGAISGKVFDEGTLEPLVGRLVHAFDHPGGSLIKYAETDSLGNYTIWELPADTYYVWVYGAPNCDAEWWENTPYPDSADPVIVPEGGHVQHINFALSCGTTTGCIAGTVTDDYTGKPINDALVRVFKNPTGDPVASTYTNSLGQYKVCELEPGAYFVHAHAANCEGEWYNNKSDPADADTVKVQADKVTYHIDFALTCVQPKGCIIGRVTDQETGKPIYKAVVKAYADPLGDPVLTTYTGEQGHYEACKLEAGIYYVHAHAERCEGEWYNDKKNPEEADSVEVIGGQDTPDINFTLECTRETGCIIGKVMDDSTGKPIVGAFVAAYLDPHGEAVGHAYTGKEGWYEICNLKAGTYFAFAHAYKCEGEWFDNKSNPDEADSIVVKAGEVTGDINFGLYCEHANTGCIVGAVTDDQTGDPVYPALIGVYKDPYGEPVAKTYTNEKGVYEICNLVAGKYFVHAHAENCEGEWYDNRSDPAEADTVVVKAGETTGHINFGLACTPKTGCITGRVTDKRTGSPIYKALVRVYKNPLGEPVLSTYTGVHGYYEVCNLEPGNYFVHAHAESCGGKWYNDKADPGEADTVVVTAGQTTPHVDFALECAATKGCIVGKVVNEETGDPIREAYVAVYLDPHGQPAAHAYTGREGWYEICNLEPGTYYAFAHAYGCEKEWFNNRTGPDSADPITVTAGEITDGVNFSLKCAPCCGCIAGRVTDARNGEPLNEAYVAIYSDPHGQAIAHAYTSSEGYYKICELKPGTYYVFAHAESCEGEWYNDKQNPDEADPVVVKAGEVTGEISFALDCIGGQNLCIWGRVVDVLSGEGIPDAFVTAMKLDTSSAGYAHTNQNGHYEICGLSAGHYVVFAHAFGYVGEFYDNVYKWEDATPVTPPADGIDFSLGKSGKENKSVMGRVFCGSGPAVGALVYAYDRSQGLGEGPVSSGITDAYGRYTLPGLSSGTYLVLASFVNLPTTSYPELVVVQNGPVEGIDIHLGVTGVGEGTTVSSAAGGLSIWTIPSPFKTATRFEFTIPASSELRLDIYDMSGRCVATLASGTLAEGTHSVEWRPDGLPSGVYISKLSCGASSVVEKVIFAR